MTSSSPEDINPFLRIRRSRANKRSLNLITDKHVLSVFIGNEYIAATKVKVFVRNGCHFQNASSSHLDVWDFKVRYFDKDLAIVVLRLKFQIVLMSSRAKELSLHVSIWYIFWT